MFIGTFWRCGENLECFGVKMSEIREFIGRIFRNPRYWSRSTGIWSRSARLPDGAERIIRVWSRAVSDLARDPLKKISALTCVDREQKLQRLAILRKFSTLWLDADREQHRLDRDQTAPNSSKLLRFGSWTPVFFQNDLIIFPKTSFHDFHGFYIKS